MRRLADDAHAAVWSLSHRVAVSPATVLLASALTLLTTQDGAWADLSQGDTLYPRTGMDIRTTLVADPTSGVHPVAALAIGELAIVAKRERCDPALPKTSFASERASQIGYANGLHDGTAHGGSRQRGSRRLSRHA